MLPNLDYLNICCLFYLVCLLRFSSFDILCKCILFTAMTFNVLPRSVIHNWGNTGARLGYFVSVPLLVWPTVSSHHISQYIFATIICMLQFRCVFVGCYLVCSSISVGFIPSWVYLCKTFIKTLFSLVVERTPCSRLSIFLKLLSKQ